MKNTTTRELLGLRRPARSAVVLLILAAVLPSVAGAQVSGAEAMKRLKALAGVWEVQESEGVFQGQSYGPVVTDPAGVVQYETRSRGNTVVATNLRPRGNEMLTVYYMDGEQLLADHFCVNGVVTRARLNSKRSDEELLAFDFLGTTNLLSPKTMYMHNDSIAVAGGGNQIRVRVDTFRDGERIERMTQTLKRTKR